MAGCAQSRQHSAGLGLGEADGRDRRHRPCGQVKSRLPSDLPSDHGQYSVWLRLHFTNCKRERVTPLLQHFCREVPGTEQASGQEQGSPFRSTCRSWVRLTRTQPFPPQTLTPCDSWCFAEMKSQLAVGICRPFSGKWHSYAAVLRVGTQGPAPPNPSTFLFE